MLEHEKWVITLVDMFTGLLMRQQQQLIQLLVHLFELLAGSLFQALHVEIDPLLLENYINKTSMRSFLLQ